MTSYTDDEIEPMEEEKPTVKEEDSPFVLPGIVQSGNYLDELLPAINKETEVKIKVKVDEIKQENSSDGFASGGIVANVSDEECFIKVEIKEEENSSDAEVDLSVECDPNELNGLTTSSCIAQAVEMNRKNPADSHCANETEKKQRGRKKLTHETFACHSCEYVATQKSHLQFHMRTHTGEKPLSCPHCNFKASHPTTMVRHIRRHTGEKPYACNQCDYRSAHPAALIAHKRSHTGERPFQCPTCPFTARESGSLGHHLRTHTGEKRYVCDICQFRTSRRERLKRHAKGKHPGAKICLDPRPDKGAENVNSKRVVVPVHSRASRTGPILQSRGSNFKKTDNEFFTSEDDDDDTVEPDFHNGGDDDDYSPAWVPTTSDYVLDRPKRRVVPPKKLDL